MISEFICSMIARMPNRIQDFFFRLYWRLYFYYYFTEGHIQTGIFVLQSIKDPLPKLKRNETTEEYCKRLSLDHEYRYTKYWAKYWIRNVKLMNFIKRYSIMKKKDIKMEGIYLIQKQKWVNLYRDAYMRKIREE